MSAPYRVIVADPPWQFSDKLPGNGRGAAKHYSTMQLSRLERIALPPVEPNAVLFLWRVSAMVEEAYRLTRAWGFTPKAELVWVKTSKLNAGKLAFGMGHYVRGSHETCIIATRGKIRPVIRNQRSIFSAPRLAHSEKPEAFYRIVESMFKGPYLELFGRRARENWTVLGNEMPEPTTLCAEVE